MEGGGQGSTENSTYKINIQFYPLPKAGPRSVPYSCLPGLVMCLHSIYLQSRPRIYIRFISVWLLSLSQNFYRNIFYSFQRNIFVPEYHSKSVKGKNCEAVAGNRRRVSASCLPINFQIHMIQTSISCPLCNVRMSQPILSHPA